MATLTTIVREIAVTFREDGMDIATRQDRVILREGRSPASQGESTTSAPYDIESQQRLRAFMTEAGITVPQEGAELMMLNVFPFPDSLSVSMRTRMPIYGDAGEILGYEVPDRRVIELTPEQNAKVKAYIVEKLGVNIE